MANDNTNIQKFEMILGSQSPRRKELMGWLDIPFKIVTSDVEEVSSETIPEKFCEAIAKLKGEDVWLKTNNENAFVVSSDTIVCTENEILGKPKDRASAKEMLLKLSGRTHQVITSVYLKTHMKNHIFSVSSEVTFDKIDSNTMELYLASGESLDKAGAYGIQGKGLTFISNLRGSYSNVVGFPLSHFVNEMCLFLGLDNEEKWRECFVS
jgi:septum formation protein